MPTPIAVDQLRVIFALPLGSYWKRKPVGRTFRNTEVTFDKHLPLRCIIQEFYCLKQFDTKLPPEDEDPKHWMVFLNKKRVYDLDPLHRLHKKYISIDTLDFILKPKNEAMALDLIGATQMEDYFTEAQRSEEIAALVKTKQEIEAAQGPKKKSEPVTTAYLEKLAATKTAIKNYRAKKRETEVGTLSSYLRRYSKAGRQAPTHDSPVLSPREQNRLDGLHAEMVKYVGRTSNLRTRATTKPVGVLTQKDEQRFSWVCKPLPDELTDSKMERAASSLQHIIDKISSKKGCLPFEGLAFWKDLFQGKWRFLDPDFLKRLASNPYMRVQHLSNALEKCQAYREPTCPTSFGFLQKSQVQYIVVCQQDSCPFKLLVKVEPSGVCSLTLFSEFSAFHTAEAHPSFHAVSKFLYLVERKEKGLSQQNYSPSTVARPTQGKQKQRDQDHSQASPVKSAISKTSYLSKRPMPSQQQASPAQFTAVSPGLADVSPGKKRMTKLADKENPSKFSYVGSAASRSLRHGRPQAAASKQIDELVLPSLPKALKAPPRGYKEYQPPKPKIDEAGSSRRSKPAPKVQSKKSVQTQQPPRQEQSSTFPQIPSRLEARKAQAVDHLKSRLCPQKSCAAHRNKIADQLEFWTSDPKVHKGNGLKFIWNSGRIGPKFYDFSAFEGVLLNGRSSVYELLEDLNRLHDFKYETLKHGTSISVVCAKKPACKFKVFLQYEHEAYWIKEIEEATHSLAAHKDSSQIKTSTHQLTSFMKTKY